MADIIHLQTKIYFGTDAVQNLTPELQTRKFHKAMVVLGGGSAYRNGAYADTLAALKAANVQPFLYAGVKPNPDADHTYAGGLFARTNKVDCVIAVGGGSVTDAAKVMALLATNPQYHDCWSYVLNSSRVKHPALPVFSVITTAGTASENNAGSVITHTQTLQKRAVFTPTATPVAAFLNPTYTYSVSSWHTAAGIFDCFSHLLEQYYEEPQFEWTRQYILAHLRTLIKYGPIAVKEPKNYEARANVMITTTMALNGIASFASNTDWKVHAMEHAVSALWDVTHGAGLALITPTYIRVRCKQDPVFFKQTTALAHELFGLKNKTAEHFIAALRAFIVRIGLPTKFSDFSEIKHVRASDRQKLYAHVVNDPHAQYTTTEKQLMQATLNTIRA